jgi:hypothetical protein
MCACVHVCLPACGSVWVRMHVHVSIYTWGPVLCSLILTCLVGSHMIANPCKIASSHGLVIGDSRPKTVRFSSVNVQFWILTCLQALAGTHAESGGIRLGSEMRRLGKIHVSLLFPFWFLWSAKVFLLSYYCLHTRPALFGFVLKVFVISCNFMIHAVCILLWFSQGFTLSRSIVFLQGRI